MDGAGKADRKLLRACSLAIIPTPGYTCVYTCTPRSSMRVYVYQMLRVYVWK